MFIRPVAAAPARADRPPGRPLLRGLLARASGTPDPGRNAARPPAPVSPAARYADPDTETDTDIGADAGTGTDASAEPTPHGSTGAGEGLVRELAQLAALAREGLLTPEEFSTAKARLLGF
ncbi:SHOCT domain-containing protein [Streptomyces sp. NBC_00513]|uniref:SHOCT domain-containing protein n=1 Tax=unclassified Streptomyces TaxID=2593676 RepID=UPI002251B60C|nr:SHOCT domain-containing protein [Streptomyces sp. NBC_00424]MCX5073388.1 SHOCT domain-containing protein [Streptomyces sp. NBC_00424]WUD43350.1 SHOCT domain-containing protein [Streptomyces sp. NBC_00513]